MALSYFSPELPELPPARAELAALNEEITTAQQDHARAQEAVDRLERPAAEVLAARTQHAALKARQLTCWQLVQMYLDRREA